MRFGVLGPLAVWTAGGDPVTVPGPRTRALLAALLSSDGRPASADRLIDDLWGDEELPGKPAAALQTRVWQLRRAFEDAEPGGRELLTLQEGGYVLRTDRESVDADRFGALTARARAADDPGVRAELLADALALWRGTAFAGFEDTPFARPVAARLEEARLAAVEEHAEARVALGAYGDVAGELGALVAAHPLRERLRAVHMRALYGAGRAGDALASYRELRIRLADELGLDPSPELVVLQQAILEQDPALGTAVVLPRARVVPSDVSRAARVDDDSAGRPDGERAERPGDGDRAGGRGGDRARRGDGDHARRRDGDRVPPRREDHPVPSGADRPAPAPAPVDESRPAPTPAPRPRPGLPVPLTELIGRQDALAEVTSLLGSVRQLTLTGPGGVGKTRLALAVADRMAGDHPDGVRLVELAARGRTEPAHAPYAVAEAVMAALGIREETASEAAAPGGPAAPADRIAEALGDQRLLLVLDNCEHVVEAVADLASVLLRRAPGLRVLATGQEPLGIPGEAIWAVPPLDVPDPARDEDVADVARSGAVRLFVARATATAPGFRLDADNAHDVATVCRRLDGIPLALELAATRVRALGVRELVARLDDRFRLLGTGHRGTPPRQQTLRAMIDWSWELLTAPEQTLLRRLAVHTDGCALAAAEEVSAGEGLLPEDVSDLLVRLVDRSLVVAVDSGDGVRYRLLESVAHYGAARLEEAGEAGRVRRRHRDHYTALAERAAPQLRGHDQRRRLRLLDAEAANLRRALDEAVRDGAAQHALRLVNALAWYWFLRGRLREALRSLGAALETSRRYAGPAATSESFVSARARARAWQAGFAVLVGDDADRTERSGGAVELSKDITDRREGARAQWFLGFALFGVGAQAASEELIRLALDGFRALDDEWGLAAALCVRANQAHVRGDLATLEDAGCRSAALFTALGDSWGQLLTVEPLAALAQMTGDYRRAARLHEDGLRIAEDLGLWPEAADQLSGLGSTATLTGDHDMARAFHERAVRIAADHSFRPGVIRAETGLALGARRAGHLDAAEPQLRHVLRWLTHMAFAPGIALVLAELGFIAEQRGDAAESLRLHLAGWSAARTTGDARAQAFALEGLAGAHAAAGRPLCAAVLLGAAHTARDSVGMPLPPAERGDVDRISAVVRGCLDEEAYRSAYARGSALTPEEAVAACRLEGPGNRPPNTSAASCAARCEISGDVGGPAGLSRSS
ncbi:AfsR/SARP family transcriptional regulator [Streptomyces flavofungini]|uniref:AfsR/SARP family transcriptional regulator n=1 Tax=Streptomyces flavofungini TaxID=68200 RepID=UPI0025B06E3A|nr:BTAD domain-containing putative transcriptional regulator [Streptomyces flavofungini]WJV44287.1 BTAD domain-containing putative transcriptional regulator [Streptomyces flavofungini]